MNNAWHKDNTITTSQIKYLDEKKGKPPPLEGQLQVIGGIVMTDGGYQGDLQKHQQSEGDREPPTPGQEAEGKCFNAKQFQQQKQKEEKRTVTNVADGKVSIENVEQSVFVLLIFAHVANVNDVPNEAAHEDDESANNDKDINCVFLKVCGNV